MMQQNSSRTFFDSLSPKTISAALSSPIRTERAIARDHLARNWQDLSYQAVISEEFQNQLLPAERFLEALSTLPQVADLPLSDQILARLPTANPSVRTQAARLIARVYPQQTPRLRPWFGEGGVRYECCFSHDCGTAWALLEWFAEQQRLPDVAFGLMLSPNFIGEVWHRDPSAARSLALRYGYFTATEADHPDELLSQDLWTVPAIRDSDTLVRFQETVRRYESRLLKILCGLWEPGFQLDQPLDPVAVCAAVRAIDHEEFVAHRLDNPLPATASQNCRPALCFHAPHTFCQKILIQEGQQEFATLGIAPNWLGTFLLERAAALVTYDADLRMERLLALKARWQRLPAGTLFSVSTWTVPVETDGDAPDLKFQAIAAANWRKRYLVTEDLSPGSTAIAKLGLVAGYSPTVLNWPSWETFSPTLIPVGIELQIPFSRAREAESLVWKQVLRACGIPSPRRPEYRALVEAALPPARSFVAPTLLPWLLRKMGMFQETVDIALHLSFPGDLGADVRFLLFCQQFLNRPRLCPAPLRFARLMSKGFAHRHRDAVPLDGIPLTGVRTELRSFRFGCQSTSSGPQRQTHFMDDIVETCLLVSAWQSSIVALQEIWQQFCEAITREAQQKPVLQELLWSDWFEATGEPRDEEFAHQLPIVQSWLAVREWVQSGQLADPLRERFAELRRGAARQVWKLLSPEAGPPSGSRMACGAPLPALPDLLACEATGHD